MKNISELVVLTGCLGNQLRIKSVISSVSINRLEKLADEETVTGRKCSELFLELLLWSFLLLSSNQRDHPYFWSCSGKERQHNLKHRNSLIGESFHIVRNIYIFFSMKNTSNSSKAYGCENGLTRPEFGPKIMAHLLGRTHKSHCYWRMHLISSVLRHWCSFYIETSSFALSLAMCL